MLLGFWEMLELLFPGQDGELNFDIWMVFDVRDDSPRTEPFETGSEKPLGLGSSACRFGRDWRAPWSGFRSSHIQGPTGC